MASEIATYLAKLPADRRAAIAKVRAVVNQHLPAGYQERFQYGGISWVVPTSRLAGTYNGQPLAMATLVSQKSYMVLHLMPIYGDAKLRAWFETAYAKSGKKADLGKGCVRFKTLDDLPLDVVGQAIAKVPLDGYVAAYEKVHAKPKRRR